MMKTLVFVLSLVASQLCYAEIKLYQNTDNTGINKREQIEVVEKYLSELGTQLKTMEKKIDENSLKLKNMEASLTSLKENELKKLQEQVAPKKAEETTATQKVNEEEMDKLKADILAIKNTDVEQLKLDINALRFSVKEVEKNLKINGK